MRGEDRQSDNLFNYIRLETRIPAEHPLRPIRKLVEEALLEPSPVLSKLYAREGRPSIPPERLLRALLLQAFYTIRSERILMEQLEHNLLFRWFVGLSMDDAVWDATVFHKNRYRLLDGDIAGKFMTCVLNLPQVRGRLSSEHFSVDGTLIEAWASMKSFVPKKEVRRRRREVEHGVVDATPSATFIARNARMTRMSRQPIRMRCSASGWKGGKTLSHGSSDDGEPQRAHR